MKRQMLSMLLMTTAVMFMACVAKADIVIGDFSSDNDGWFVAADGGLDPSYYSSERVDRGGGTMALRANFLPTSTSPDAWTGWAGLSKVWDSTGQEDVTTLTINIDSDHPWEIHVLASFEGVGEKDFGWQFWPNGTYTYTASSFGVTAEQFNTINGVRLYMDASSGTNGGGRTGTEPMWIQVYDVTLDGTVPEPATMVLLGVGACAALVRRKK